MSMLGYTANNSLKTQSQTTTKEKDPYRATAPSHPRRSIMNSMNWLRLDRHLNLLPTPLLLKATLHLLRLHLLSPRMRRHRSKGINMLQRMPQQRGTEPRENHSRPQKNHTRNRPSILAILQWTPPILSQRSPRTRCIRPAQERALRRNNIRVRQRAGQRQRAREHGTRAPRGFHAPGLAALGPEEVKEEGGAEDSGDEDADEDVVAGDADEVVVVHCGAGGVDGDELLLVDIIWGCGVSGGA